MEYHYKASGLDNVRLVGLPIVRDDEGDECVTIPNVNGLNKAIAEAIVNRQRGITGQELRFLRTLMGKTQAQLADDVHKDGQSLGRWEREETPLDPNAEALIRFMAREMLGLHLAAPVNEVTRWCANPTNEEWITIDARDPEDYKEMARGS
jgi:transcriptional regulator with XRE-family HTH domain